MPVAVADAEPSEESVPYVSIILPCYNEEGQDNRQGGADLRGDGHERLLL